MKKTENRAFIDQALTQLGLTLQQLATRLEYKSLRRAYAGEIPLPASRVRHIQDLVKLAKNATPPTQEAPTATAASAQELPAIEERSTSPVVREESPIYGALINRALTHMPLEVLLSTSQRLLTGDASEIDFAAVREILTELERRANVAKQSSQP